MSNSELADHISVILAPEKGWWKSSTENAIFDIAVEMLDANIEETLARDLISNLISAIREEYGE